VLGLNSGKFCHFTDAAEDVAWLSKSGGATPAVRAMASAIWAYISGAMKFYLPDGGTVLEGRRISSDLKEMLRMPYPVIAVLNETTFHRPDGTPEEPGLNISIAIDRDHMVSEFPNLSALKHQPPGFLLMSLINSSRTRALVPLGRSGWLPMADVAYVGLPEGVDGYTLRAMEKRGESGAAGLYEYVSATLSDLNDDAMAVMNLCAMLSMHNVEAERRTPPEKLQRKRQRNGKLPLYSYHVLKVDGQAWDSPDRGFSTDSHGVRSHMRRGHIRRLNGGERRVWVRATFVHGSKPGFVDKDYEVSHAA